MIINDHRWFSIISRIESYKFIQVHTSSYSYHWNLILVHVCHMSVVSCRGDLPIKSTRPVERS